MKKKNLRLFFIYIGRAALKDGSFTHTEKNWANTGEYLALLNNIMS